MKRGEQPLFSAKWWKDSQPDGLTSAHRLESALRGYEAAKHALETRPGDAVMKGAMGELSSVEAAVKAVIAEAARTASKNPDMKMTIECLRKLDTDKEHDWVAAKGHDDDDADDSPVGAEAYPPYLLRMLRRLRMTPMNFALVLGRGPAEHRLSLHRVTGPMALGHRLVRDTGLHLMTFGTARPDPDKDRTIQLTIEGRQLPAVKRKTERMLRVHRPLPFQFISLFSGGAEIEDIDDPDDHDVDLPFDDDPISVHEAELRAEITRIRPRLTAAMQGSAETRRMIMSTVERFVSALKAGDLTAARAQMVALHALIPGEAFSLNRPDLL